MKTERQQEIFETICQRPIHKRAMKLEKTLREQFRASEHLSADWYSLRTAYYEAENALYALERKLMAQECKRRGIVYR